MNSYKVGDYARVRDDLVVGEWYGSYSNDESDTFEEGMESFKGKVVKIEEVLFNGGYEISDYTGHYSDYRWVDKMFYDEPIEVGDWVRICGFDFSGDYKSKNAERMLIATTNMRKTLGMEGLVKDVVGDSIKVETVDGAFYYEKVWLKKIDTPKVVPVESPKEVKPSLKYKVGDTVMVINEDSIHYNKVGTVEEARNDRYLIRFYSGKELYYWEYELEEAPMHVPASSMASAEIEPLTPPSESTLTGHVIALSSEPSEPKTVDVGYFISRDRKGVIENVFWVHGVASKYDKVLFQDKDNCRYVFPTEAIQWVVPHVEK